MLGTLIHYGIDALLISTVLAGLQRTTGLEVALSRVQSKDVRSFLKGYLELGQYTFDLITVFFGRSSFFERKR